MRSHRQSPALEQLGLIDWSDVTSIRTHQARNDPTTGVRPGTAPWLPMDHL